MAANTAVPYAPPAAAGPRPAAQHQCIRAAHARLRVFEYCIPNYYEAVRLYECK
eukprot:COSAG01_NODE_31_length_35900_cov_44.332169_23_plen_54_part_00